MANEGNEPSRAFGRARSPSGSPRSARRSSKNSPLGSYERARPPTMCARRSARANSAKLGSARLVTRRDELSRACSSKFVIHGLTIRSFLPHRSLAPHRSRRIVRVASFASYRSRRIVRAASFAPHRLRRIVRAASLAHAVSCARRIVCSPHRALVTSWAYVEVASSRA